MSTIAPIIKIKDSRVLNTTKRAHSLSLFLPRSIESFRVVVIQEEYFDQFDPQVHGATNYAISARRIKIV